MAAMIRETRRPGPTRTSWLARLLALSVSRRSAVFAALALLTLAVATVLRLIDLDRIGFNSDEAVYAGQAASLAGNPEMNRLFSPFRAHPLLVHTLLAMVFRHVGVSDTIARSVVAVGFGVTGVIAVAWLANRMYGPKVALLSAAILALLPYHVILSRQVMLEVPAATLMTITAGCLYLHVRSGRRAWLGLASLMLGLVVLTKAGTIVFAVALGVFYLWSGALRWVRALDIGLAVVLGTLAVAPYPLTRLAFGGETTSSYILFQLFRPANHPAWYFPVVLWKFTAPLFLLLVAVGLVIMLRRRSIADRLLLSWFFVLVSFHQLWPTKLFPYLIVVTPVMAIAASQGALWVVHVLCDRIPRRSYARAAAVMMVGALLVPLAFNAVEVVTRGAERLSGPLHLDAEVQDFAGSREAALWIDEHTPDGSVFMTIGPSMGNIVGYYAHRDWYALSVSPDPSRRNPAYVPLDNPDYAIRRMHIQYAVWDHYSADRSAFYNARLMRYVRKYGGTPVLYVWLDERSRPETGPVLPDGTDARVVVYDLVGGDPPVARRGPGP